MKLHTLKQSKGIIEKSNQLGRGNASKGNYSGKGHKGQKARSGHSMKPFFEGGQTSIIQRLPKRRGFKRYFKLIQETTAVNIDRLEKDTRITTAPITHKLLVSLWYVHKDGIVKILGKGTLTKKLQFSGITHFSKSAREAIEKAGGTIA